MVSSNETAELTPSSNNRMHTVSLQTAANWLLRVSFLATICVYARVIAFDWVFDDYPQIVMNGWLRGWRHIPDFFTNHMWAFAYPKWPGKYYRPGFLLWMWGNFHLFGTTPGWWHATAVIAHLIASVFVYLIAKELIPDRWVSSMAAAIFVIHPIHIEAVAWVAGATETLVTVLLLASIYCYLIRDRWKPTARIGISITCYVAALLSKETAIVLPLILFVFAWAHEAGSAIRKLRRCLVVLSPYATVTALYLVARVIALKGFAHPDQVVSIKTQLLTMPSILWFYLHHLVWPWNLSLFYDVDLVRQVAASNFWLPLLGILLAATGLIYAAHRRRELQRVVWLILLPLLPVLAGIRMFQQHDYVHDRYLYLPSVGVAILIAVAIRQISLKIASSEQAATYCQIALVAAVVFVFAVGIHLQLDQWDSDYSVFARGVEVAKENPLPRRYLGETLISLGRPWDAIQLFKQALDRDPKSWLDSYCLGTTYLRMKDWVNAKRYLQVTVENQPTSSGRDPLPIHQLGWAELNLGDAHAAETHFRQAIAIRSEGAGFHRALGVALQRQNRLEEARAEFRADDVVKADYLKGQDFEGK